MSLPGGDRSALESSSTFVCDRTPLIRYSPLPEKVLHLDPKKIIPGKSRPEAQKQLFEKQLIFSWPHKFMSAGLVNLRNTCFLASVVQCLQHIPALNGYLMHQHGRHSEERACVVCMMSRLTRLCFSSPEPVEPKELANNLQEIASHLIRGRQEDAHEFLHSLLNRMQEDLMHGIDPKPNQYEEMTTSIGQIFGGFLRSQIVCLGCNRASNSYESLLSISLEIKSARSLEESLDSFVSSEDMGAEEWYSCDTCKMKQRAVKSYSIDTPPRILIIHLKRYNQVDRFQSKLSNHVEFKERLNLEPYVNSEKKTGPLTYDLSSVLVHLGTQIGAGHYYSYVADPSTFDQPAKRSWFVMNDEVVQPTSWMSVRNSEAYMLFYVRTDCKLKTGDHSRLQFPRPKETLEQPSILPSISIPRIHLSLDNSCPDNLSNQKDAKPCSNPSKFLEHASNSGDGPKLADNHQKSQNRLVTLDKRDSFKQPDQVTSHGSGDHIQHSSSKRKLSDSFEPSQKRQKVSEEASKCHTSSSEVPPFRNETKRSHDKSEPPFKENHRPGKSLRRHYSDFSHYRKRSRSRHESHDKRSFSRDRRHRSRSKGERSRDTYDRSRDRCQRERSRSRVDYSRDNEPYRHQRHSYPWSKSYYREDINRDRWRHHWSPSRRHRSRERDRRDNSRKSRERRSRS